MTVVNITNHGRITIPSQLRKKYGWKDGDKVIIVDHPLEGVKILPYISEDQMAGVLDKNTGIKIVREISIERQTEVESEKNKL
jgi:AbrB family looped-hinge helix DNA binding protein